jgi:hypothetical protein
MESVVRGDVVQKAARVLSEHFPRADRVTCLCGSRWHPRHQAEVLDRAGLLASR